MDIQTLDNLIAKEEIRDLMARYVYYADHKDWLKFASLFTESGSFEPRDVSGNPLISMVGRDTIGRTISARVKDAIAIHHLFSNEIEIISEGRAKGVFAMEDYLFHPEQADTKHAVQEIDGHDFKTLHGFGHYHAEFLKIDGVWLIDKLVQTRLKMDLTY